MYTKLYWNKIDCFYKNNCIAMNHFKCLYFSEVVRYIVIELREVLNTFKCFHAFYCTISTIIQILELDLKSLDIKSILITFYHSILCGLSQLTTKAHIARACLESTCFQTREVLDAMARDCHSGHQVSALQVDGGMTANNLLMQMQADLAGITVGKSTNVE